MASRSLLPLAIASTIALAAPTTRLMPRDSNPSIPLVPQFVVDFGKLALIFIHGDMSSLQNYACFS